MKEKEEKIQHILQDWLEGTWVETEREARGDPLNTALSASFNSLCLCGSDETSTQ